MSAPSRRGAARATPARRSTSPAGARCSRGRTGGCPTPAAPRRRDSVPGWASTRAAGCTGRCRARDASSATRGTTGRGARRRRISSRRRRRLRSGSSRCAVRSRRRGRWPSRGRSRSTTTTACGSPRPARTASCCGTCGRGACCGASRCPVARSTSRAAGAGCSSCSATARASRRSRIASCGACWRCPSSATPSGRRRARAGSPPRPTAR